MAYAGSIRKDTSYTSEVDLAHLYRHPLYLNQSSKSAVEQITIRFSHDIALVKLKNKGFPPHVNDGTHYVINTICLPNNFTQLNTEYENATFTGWGAIDDRKTLPEVLQKGQVRLKPYKRCAQPPMILCGDQSGPQPKGCPVSKLLIFRVK